MVCRRCKSPNVTVHMQEVGAKTSKRGNGIVGHTNNYFRAAAAIGTFGISNLFWKKSKGNSKTKIKSEKVCICQDCGYSWKIN